MNAETINRLNTINRAFYQATADDFDATRQHAWSGWERLLPHLASLPKPLRVLDVGCGNGRFALYLQRHTPIQYHGIDNSAALLRHARTALDSAGLADARLDLRDIVEQPPDTGEYDLVALFGVLHHIPGATQRSTLLQRLAARVAQGGLLVLTAWRFYDDEKWRARIVPFEHDLAGQIEAGDYLLDWRRGTSGEARPLRYCHYVDDAEHAALVEATGLHEIERYRADALNLYSILRRD